MSRNPTLQELAEFPAQRSKTLNASVMLVMVESGEISPPLRLAVDGWDAHAAAALLAAWLSNDAGRAWVVPKLFNHPNVAAVLLPVVRPGRVSMAVVHPVGWTDEMVTNRLAIAVNSFDPTAFSN
ncbi:hypothetical protein [Antrihabitans stalactiti]|uniref:Uncharacterized protein n=1 Tax=Antrihabitans stalactiti TaxID=2584121 RepID=A0A848K849_9NOCA|nr:hypothetical protein [Antrihabitans stalactiti]NMN94519.1 hypothetical protein [Antrihabitans stalactiti]